MIIQASIDPVPALDDTFGRITSSILTGHKILVIVRGLPGSGKSYLARSLVNSTVGGDPNQFIFSTDDYFVMIGFGEYRFNVSRLHEAHRWNEERVFNATAKGVSPVIVDNTNTRVVEMKPYVVLGVRNGYLIEVLEPNTLVGLNVDELVRRNNHGVPENIIRTMIESYEHNLTGQKLVQQCSLSYLPGNSPPQLRKFPPLRETQEGQD